VVNEVALLRATVADASGDTKGAYDSLVLLQAKSPSDDVKKALVKYGAKINKTNKDLDKTSGPSVKKRFKAAPDFNLGLYTSDKISQTGRL